MCDVVCSGLPPFLWAEAESHGVWLGNRLPMCALDGKTPYEARYHSKLDLSKLVPFGTKAWVKIINAGKLEPRAKMGYFVGFDNESTGYRIFLPDKHVVAIEREVVFDTSWKSEEVTFEYELTGGGTEKTKTGIQQLRPAVEGGDEQDCTVGHELAQDEDADKVMEELANADERNVDGAVDAEDVDDKSEDDEPEEVIEPQRHSS